MIRRETDATLVNRISNMPGVFEHVCKHGYPMDWTAAIDALVVVSNGIDAVGVFEETEPGRWQAHTMFARTCRGLKALQTGRDILSWAFANGAEVVWGATPIANAKARWFNRKCGAKVIGTSIYPVDGPVELFEVEKSAWLPQS